MTSLRSKTALVAAAAVVLAALASAVASGMTMSGSGTHAATISGSGFNPTKLTILTGEAVKWTDEGGSHTVTSVANTFASRTLGLNDTFSYKFTAPGTFRYYCAIHRYMTGEIDVADILLTGAPSIAVPGRPLTLRGRAALPGGTPVTIQGDSGAGFVPVGTANVGDDGTFSATVTPRTTTTYRAISGEMRSGAVRVPVVDHRVTITVSRTRHSDTIHVQVSPASPRATVVLQLNLRERFGWWPTQQKKLDRSSRLTFTLRSPRRVPARVALTLADGATQLAVSNSARL